MHMVSAMRENVRGVNDFLRFEASHTFKVHAPWDNGTWFWDIGGTTDATGRSYSAGVTSVGAKTVFSGHRDPTTSLTGFRLNGGTTYQSTGSTSGIMTTGISLGGTGLAGSRDLSEWFIFSAKLPLTDELLLESHL